MAWVAEALSAAVDAAFNQLRNVSEAQAAVRPGPMEWSKKEIIGHLIDSAANNHQRFVRAQQQEKLVFPPYDQESWVRLNDYQGRSWQHLLDLWKLYNAQLVHVIDRIPAEKRSTICRIGLNAPVTLEFLVEDYLVHMRHHFKQLGLNPESIANR